MIRSDMFTRDGWVQGLWILVAVFVTIASVLYVIYAIRKMLTPLNKLLNIFHSNEDYKRLLSKSQDELSFLMTSVSSLMKKEHVLEKKLKSNMSELRRWFLYQLLIGSINDAETIRRKMKELGIMMSPCGFFICVLRIDDYRQFVAKYNSGDQELLRYFMAKLAEELALTKRFSAFYINTKHRDIALICNVDSEFESIDGIRKDMLDLAAAIHEHIAHYVPLTASIGIGDYRRQVGEVPESYNEALQVLEYMALKNKHMIMAKWMVDGDRTSHRDVYMARKKAEKEIGFMQSSGDYEKLGTVLSKLQSVFEQLQNCPLSFIHSTFWELTMYAVHRIHKQGIQSSAGLDLSEMYQESPTICKWILLI